MINTAFGSISRTTSGAPTPFTLPKYVPELDGLRAAAILSVMCIHTASRFQFLHLDGAFAFGWIGVDLFFVLSGFLITGILLDSGASKHYFRNFYARRILRIWPIYFLLIFIAFAVFPLISARQPYLMEHLPHETRSAWVYLAFLQNLIRCGQPNQLVLGVTWSLAIEEQFYLVWPLLVRFASKRTLAGIVIAILAVSPLLRWLVSFHFPPNWIYQNTACRLDGLALGALIAIAVRSGWASRNLLLTWSLVALAFGTLGSFLMVPPGVTDPAPPLAFTSLALTFGGILGITLCLVGRETLLNRVLTFAPLRYVGRISYCLYLVHLPIFEILNSNFVKRKAFFGETTAGDIHVILIGFTFSLLIATLSWYLVESPILRLKRLFVDQSEGRHSSRKVSECLLQPDVASSGGLPPL